MLDVETLCRECSDDLYRALRRRFDRSVPDQLIEDACQAAWLIAWRYRDRLGDECPLDWLVTVAWHEALALLRECRRERSGVEARAHVDQRSDLELALAAREALALLQALTANQRRALALQAGGYSYAELQALSRARLSSTHASRCVHRRRHVATSR